MIVSALRRLLEPIRQNGRFDVASAMAKGRVVIVEDGATPVRWLITNRNDEIQSRQISNGYYERPELEQLRCDLGVRRTILDIGANIGNHAVYFVKHLGCQRLIPIEPYQPAIRHLLANIALNYSPAYDLAFLGKAVGPKPGFASVIEPTAFNMGLTRVDTKTPGNTEVQTGDAIVGDSPIDLIKIDVEGMELEVLAGLSETLRRCRPALFIEVSDPNRLAFLKILEDLNYCIIRDIRAYGKQSNFTVVAQNMTSVQSMASK